MNLMNKLLIASLLFLGSMFYADAQQDLTGRILDNARQPIPFATVVLLHPADSVMKFFGVTNDDGIYQIRRVKDGDYLMQFSFTGLKTVYRSIKVPLSAQNLGDLQMEEDSRLLGEIIVEAELIPIKFKTDTLEYDTKAFKTREGAAVEELLGQLPGVEVDKEGNVKAQGEDVLKILVDGKEFFGNDPKVATKNLPANSVNKVQVVDRKSEQAVFTGIEDGQRERTINLILKDDHKNGYFGELKAGAGSQATHIGEAKIYRFSEKIQAAVLGLQNNINQFGFTHKGNEAFGENTKGTNESFAGGLNLSRNKTNGDRYFASYLGNSRKMNLFQTTTTQNFLESGVYNQNSELTENEKDKPNDIDFGVRQKIGEKQMLVLDGDITLGSARSNGQTVSNTSVNGIDQNRFNNSTLNESDQLSIVSNNSYSIKIKGDDFQFSSKFGVNYNENESVLDWTNITTVFAPEITTNVHQFRNNQTSTLGIHAIPTFTRKINSTWSIDLGASLNSSKRELNRTEGVFNDQGEIVNSSIPDFKTVENTVIPFLTFRRATSKEVLSFALRGQSTNFEKSLTNGLQETPSYFYFAPQLRYRNQYRSGRRVEASYATSPSFPNPNQLFPIENNLNQVSIYKGNFDLKPEVNHSLNLLWSVFDEFSFTSFFVRLVGTHAEHKINNAVTIDDKLIQTTSLVNTDGQTALSANIDFSTPLRSLGLNLNASLLETWSKGITFVNGQENNTETLGHNLTLSFENRTKEKVRVNFGGTVNYTQYAFSVSDIPDDNYFNIGYFANLRYTPAPKWNFTADANVTNYNAQSFGESVTIPLITASASYSFLQAEKATIALTAFDLLNKYQGFQRISTANFLSQTEWNTISQYFMLTFSYRFR